MKPEETLKEKKKRIRKRRKFTLLTQNKSRCYWCNAKLTAATMTRDHVIPKSNGGSDKLKNLVLSCGECNNAKGNEFWPLTMKGWRAKTGESA